MPPALSVLNADTLAIKKWVNGCDRLVKQHHLGFAHDGADQFQTFFLQDKPVAGRFLKRDELSNSNTPSARAIHIFSRLIAARRSYQSASVGSHFSFGPTASSLLTALRLVSTHGTEKYAPSHARQLYSQHGERTVQGIHATQNTADPYAEITRGTHFSGVFKVTKSAWKTPAIKTSAAPAINIQIF